MTVTPIPPPLEPIEQRKQGIATLRTIAAMILREMSSTYGRSPGGYLWAVLEPLGAIIILAVAFSLMLRSPSLGNNFLLFYATGYLPFQLYNTTQNKISGALKYSKGLLTYPSVTWLDAVLARIILNTLTSSLVIMILMTGILTFTNAHAVINIAPIVVACLMAVLIGSSIGMVNSVLFHVVPVWRSLWVIITRPLFIASGVLFVYEDLPSSVNWILWLNPLIHITGLVRAGTYSTYRPEYISLVYVGGMGLVLTALGLIFLGRYHKMILQD